MKKILICTQALILFLFLAKIFAVSGIMQKLEESHEPIQILSQAQAMSAKPAVAKTPAQPAPIAKESAAPVQENSEADNLKGVREFVIALDKRKTELDAREASVRTEEQKLNSLKKEIMEKINLLKSLETEINSRLDTEKTAQNKKYKDLAKVIESTPADKAGSMLERMDVKTAAAITLNMKKDKAGIVWGFISPQKAVEITKEITRAGKFAPEEKVAGQ